jgi:hypothetical protein
MPTVNDSSFVIRLLRRLGRFAVAMVATVAFFAGGAAAWLLLWLLMSLTGYVVVNWVFLLAFFAACSCAVGTFRLFERFELLPDDPSEPPTTLGLGSGR